MIIDYITGAILGIIQGIAELLPISSSGHLAIAQSILGWNAGVLRTTVFLHIGSAFAILIVFHKEIKSLALDLPKLPLIVKNEIKRKLAKLPGKSNLTLCILLSLILTAPIALWLHKSAETMFNSPHSIGIALMINAFLLVFAALVGKRRKQQRLITYSAACVIGIAQALAVPPGISRLGMTLVAALLLGIDEYESARYSILLSFPTILLASIVEISRESISGITFGPLIIGIAAAVMAGIFALRILLLPNLRKRLLLFGIYCLVAGVSVCLLVD